MPRIEGTTNAQSVFLRSLHKSDFGPGCKDWPAPTVLRRWLKKPGFTQAMASIRRTMHFQADFQLACAAVAAGQRLASLLGSEITPEQRPIVQGLIHLLKLSHMRRRFPFSEPQPKAPVPGIIKALRQCHPNHPTGKAYTFMIERLEKRNNPDDQDYLRQLKQARAALGTSKHIILRAE